MATLHRPTLLNSVLSPFITTLSLILFITTTAASPVLSSASNSIIQLAGIGPAACEEGSTSIGKQFPRPRPGDCSSLAGQLRYDPTASDKTRITGEEHFLRGSGTCQLYIYTTHDGSDADEVTLNELADGVDKIVQECFENPTYTGGGFQAGDEGFLQVWVTGHWDPWPENGGATNSTAVTANVPKCEDGSSVVGKQYSKPVVADCTALSQMLRTSPAASHEQLITRQEKFLRRSGTCQLSIITHPMVRPAQDYASFNDLADGIDSVVESCIDTPTYKGGDIQAGTLKLLTLQVTGIWNPFGAQGLLAGGIANGTGAAAARVDTT